MRERPQRGLHAGADTHATPRSARMAHHPDRSATMHLPMPWIATALALLVGACTAAPNGETASSADAAAAPAQPVMAARPVPKLPQQPATPPRTGTVKDATAAQEVDYSCATDADCTVKDVGNCCGYYPACVNVDSPTFPDQVKAECARSGTMSVCGFPAIEGCQCVDNRCQPGAGGAQLQ